MQSFPKNAPFTERSAGVLLPIFSLPSFWGIGGFGAEATRFLTMIRQAGFRYWQILPLGPTEIGRGNSPYSASSAFALNPLYIDPEGMLEEGLAHRDDFPVFPDFPTGKIDYSLVTPWKELFMRRTWKRNSKSLLIRKEIDLFSETHQAWLSDYALFSSMKRQHKGKAWNKWGQLGRSSVGEAEMEALTEEVLFEKYVQYVLFMQWGKIRDFAKKIGVFILGDLPFYVDYDSSDVWAHQILFDLDDGGEPRSVGGVPPDYYSKDGQRWGNPVYNWDVMEEKQFSWWIERVAHALTTCDGLRLDHFRGFAACWEIDSVLPTAVGGCWKNTPGESLFTSMKKALGTLPFFAEDLGVITEDVRQMQSKFGFPGMKVLHFCFDNYQNNPYALHNHTSDSVVFTGSHDNNTSRGWYSQDLTSKQLEIVREVLGKDVGSGNIHRFLIQKACESVANTAIIPMQDILGLGSNGRINIPAVPYNNWAWRLCQKQMQTFMDESSWLSIQLSLSGRD